MNECREQNEVSDKKHSSKTEIITYVLCTVLLATHYVLMSQLPQ